MPIPKSTPKKRVVELLREDIYHIKKPDRDNMQKYVSDVLECAGIFKNDSQVCCGFSAKYYSGNPRTEIVVSDFSSNAAC